MGFSYRHSLAPEEVVFTGAMFQGRPGEPKAIEAEMERITQAREASQPIREKTGGSTFKNPLGMKAWELIDKAGCRGLTLGGAQVSTMHCNFLINLGSATAADLEALGEEVRRRVFETSGIALEWEIKRIGHRWPGSLSGAKPAQVGSEPIFCVSGLMKSLLEQGLDSVLRRGPNNRSHAGVPPGGDFDVWR